MATLLIVDDNAQIRDILQKYAARDGYGVLLASDGQQALDVFYAHEKEISLVLLDVMMPKRDGFSVCREIRRGSMVPIIMVTARGENYDRILGLDTGADDYIVKPFSAAEVMARIRAILRRLAPQQAAEKLVAIHNLKIDIGNYLVTIDGQEVTLTKREKEILFTLAAHPRKVFTRDNLLDSIWGMDYDGDSRTVDSHMKRLRAKLEKYPHPNWELRTIWGVGYKFEDLGGKGEQ